MKAVAVAFSMPWLQDEVQEIEAGGGCGHGDAGGVPRRAVPVLDQAGGCAAGAG